MRSGQLKSALAVVDWGRSKRGVEFGWWRGVEGVEEVEVENFECLGLVLLLVLVRVRASAVAVAVTCRLLGFPRSLSTNDLEVRVESVGGGIDESL